MILGLSKLFIILGVFVSTSLYAVDEAEDCKAPQDGLDQVNEALDLNTCFEEKKNPDSQTCACLSQKTRKVKAYDDLFKNIKIEENSKALLFNAKKKLKILQGKRNSLTIQASLLLDKNGGRDAAIYISDEIDRILPDKKVANLPKGQFRDIALSHLSKLKTPPDVSDLLKDKPFAPGQCIGKREYLALIQLPSGDFLKELRATSDFNEADWNLSKLQEQADADPKNEAILGKIKFLKRNPLVRTLMSSQSEKTLGMKKTLFETLKASVASSDCVDNGSKVCTLDNGPSLTEKGIMKYKELMSQFFSNRKNAETVKALNDESIEKDINDLVNLDKYTAENVSPMDCARGENKDLEQCIALYGAYCKKLDTKEERYSQKRSSTQASDYLSGNLDVGMENKEFKAYNDEVCNSKKKWPDSNDKTGKTFFEYRNEYCSKKPFPDECRDYSPDKMRIIRTAYLNGYEPNSMLNRLEKTEFVKDVSSSTLKEFATVRSTPRVINWDEVSQKYGGDKLPSSSEPSSTLSSSLASNNSTESSETPNLVQPFGNESPASNSGPASVDSSSPTAAMAQAELPKVEEAIKETENNLKEAKREVRKIANSTDDNDRRKKSDLEKQIAALNAQLLKQKEQFKVLNEVIKNEQVVADERREDSRRPRSENNGFENNSGTPNFVTNSNVSDNRSLASLNEMIQANTSAGSQAGLGSAKRSGSSSRAVSDSANLAAVQREQAKLLANGSLTVIATPEGTTSQAVVVNVPDELYKIATANPVDLKLEQIKNSIPDEQFKKLKTDGDYLVLYLQNGKNPPLEVRVRNDKQYGLVKVERSSVRTATLSGLINTLK